MRTIVVLAGGVGAARFLRGLAAVVDTRRLLVVGNTADDEEFFGLHISPDLDTLTYSLAGLAPPRRGWGVADDTFTCLDALGRFYATTWFRLGDRDLATQLYRTERLRAGEPLSRVTQTIARRFGIRARIVPMTDQRVRTFVHTNRGRQPFQTYLARDGGRGRVRRIELSGIAHARPAPGLLAAVRRAALVIIPPSNPIVSIGPILGIPGMRTALREAKAPVAAVSPLIGGRPVRGPADRMLRGLGIEASAVGVASLYAGLVDLFVLDRQDAGLASRVAALGPEVLVADTLLSSPDRAAALARSIIAALSTVGCRRRTGRPAGRPARARRTRGGARSARLPRR